MVYRRRRGDASNPGHRGVWLGPGEVVAAESTSDKLVPRVVYVTVHGRLFLCSPEQLRPVSLKAEWVRNQLKSMDMAQQQTFQDMRVARGTDVRAEPISLPAPVGGEVEIGAEQHQAGGQAVPR